MSKIKFHIADAEEYPRIEEAYVTWGYGGGLLPEDIIYVAEADGELVAIVRRTCEQGVVMLRGMYVAPRRRRCGIGSELLSKFVNDLHAVTCYCVPFAHLQAFYGRGGFVPVSDDAAPRFLQDRLKLYRADRLDVLVMRRP